MPIKHAALKQIRKDRVRAVRNQALQSALKTIKKRWLGLIEAKQVDEARQLLPSVIRTFDQAVTKKIIHKNTASRTKSRLMRRLAAVSSS